MSHINIVQVAVPQSPPNKPKSKNLNELLKIEELLVCIVIISKRLSVNHWFAFLETLEVSKNDTESQSAMQQWLTKIDTLYSGIKKLSSYPTECYHKFCS